MTIPPSQTPGETPELTQEAQKMTRKQPQTPGETPQANDAELLTDEEQQIAAEELEHELSGPASDDAALEAGQQGRAHKIAKPRAPVAPADLGGMADVTRPEKAAINAKKQMTVPEAMALDADGKLQRATMTDQGWYVPRNSVREQAERRRNGQPAIIDVA